MCCVWKDFETYSLTVSVKHNKYFLVRQIINAQITGVMPFYNHRLNQLSTQPIQKVIKIISTL